jgi:hypothetical protein
VKAPTIDAANNASAISVFTFGFSCFWLMFWVTHQENKKTADLHQAAEASVEIFSFGRLLSRTSTLAGQGTLSSPTTGCRIRFFESLLMLRYTNRRARRFVKFAIHPGKSPGVYPRCLHCLNGNPLGLTKLRSIAPASEANARWNLVIPVRAFELFGDLVGQRPKQLRTGVTRERFW